MFIALDAMPTITVAIILNKVVDQRSNISTNILLSIVDRYRVFAFLRNSDGFINKSIHPLFEIDYVCWHNETKYWMVIFIVLNTLENPLAVMDPILRHWFGLAKRFSASQDNGVLELENTTRD